jgi:predicted TIM-barrel fold metal-dependent hydrolase
VPTYDVHQHLWPEALVRALERRREPPRLRGQTLELAGEGSFEIDLGAHELDRRIALLDRDGIDVAVVSLAPTLETETHAELRDAYHEGIRELVDASNGRMIALAAGESREGFPGCCVSAASVVAGIEPVLADVEASGGVLFVHPGPPAAAAASAPPWWAAVVDYTSQMQAAYAAWIAQGAFGHPRLPIVFAILAGGAPFQVERLGSRGVEPTAAFEPTVYFEAASYGPRALEFCLATAGAPRLLYGSDVPVIDSAPTLAAVRSLGDSVARRVLDENPTAIFG